MNNTILVFQNHLHSLTRLFFIDKDLKLILREYGFYLIEIFEINRDTKMIRK